jgi:haloacetate dehalogenase
MDSQLAFAWFHWHLMRQPSPLPETLIGNSVKVYLDFLLERWTAIDGSITEAAYAEYLRCFSNPETIHATCMDYRSIELDLVYDEADRRRKLTCPVLVLWGANMAKRPGWQTGARLDILTTWRERAVNVRGKAFDCGHFLPEERPEETAAELLAFLSAHELPQ